MKLFRRIPIKKTMIFVSISIIAVLLILLTVVFLTINSHIDKMNLVSLENVDSHDETYDINSDSLSYNNYSPDIDDSPEFPNSPQDEIDLAEERIRANMEENQTPILDKKDLLNILLIGSDTRRAGGTGRSDAMIIVSINKKTRKITATSIMRDIYLHIPGKNNNRANAAYALGGADLLMDTIEQNFKIELNRFVSVDFYSFIDVIDEIGGVTLEVSQNELSKINNFVAEINILNGEDGAKEQLIEPGFLLLNGKQVLGYSRNRSIGNSDFDRTARQRKVLEEIFKSVKDMDLLELDGLVNLILPKVTTNLTKGELFSLILGLPSYTNYDLQQLRIPIDGSFTNMRVRGMAVLNIDFEENIKEIQRRIYEAKNY